MVDSRDFQTIIHPTVLWRRDLVVLNKNPMRQLPLGYAGKSERYVTWEGERSRRLSEDGVEEGAIRKVLIKTEEHLFFDMVLETAIRHSTINIGAARFSSFPLLSFAFSSYYGRRKVISVRYR